MDGARIRRALRVLGFLALVAALARAVQHWGYRAALTEMSRRGASDLALASDRLTSELQRYRQLSVLTARHPYLAPRLDGPDGGRATALLRQTADMTGALDIVLLDRFGRQIAAAGSVARRGDAGTPWFERALDGALGVAHL